MALGRPGLEPCVPLEVRFESCYWSAEQRHTSRPRLSVGLDLLPALDLKNVPRDSQSPSPVSPVFHHLTPDAKSHSHPAFSSLLKSLPLTSCSHLSLCNILGGSHSCKDSVLPTFFKKNAFPGSPQVPFIIWSPQHGRNRRKALWPLWLSSPKKQASSPEDSYREKAGWLKGLTVIFVFSSATKSSRDGRVVIAMERKN